MRQIGVKNVKLSEYEMSIAAHLVDPLSMQVTPRVVKLKLLETADGGATRKRAACGFFTCASHTPSSCMQITWRDIAGLDEVITELKETVILPVQKRHLFLGSRLLQPPKGQRSFTCVLF